MRYIFLGLFVFIGICFCACSRNEKVNNNQHVKQNSPANESIELDIMVTEYGPKTQEWWERFTEKFNEKNESITVNVEVIPKDEIYTKVNTRLVNNQAPDIVNIDTISNYQSNNLLLPVKDFIAEKTYNKFFLSFLNQSNIEDEIWAVPDYVIIQNLFVNIDILNAAGIESIPTTWEELALTCEAIKKNDSEIYPLGVDKVVNENPLAFACYSWGNGGSFVDYQEDWAINSEKNEESVKYMMNLHEQGYTVSEDEIEENSTLNDLFLEGKLAMVVASNQFPAYLKNNGYKYNYEIASFPNNIGTPFSIGEVKKMACFDNDYSEKELEAITTFFDYYFQIDSYKERFLLEDFIPATLEGVEIMVKQNATNLVWQDSIDQVMFYPEEKLEWSRVVRGIINIEQQAIKDNNIKNYLDELQDSVVVDKN